MIVGRLGGPRRGGVTDHPTRVAEGTTLAGALQEMKSYGRQRVPVRKMATFNAIKPSQSAAVQPLGAVESARK